MLIIRTLIASLVVLALTVGASEARVKKKPKPVDEDTAQATTQAGGTVYGGNLPNSGNANAGQRGASLSSSGNTSNSQQVIVPKQSTTANSQKAGDKSSGNSTQSHGKH